MLVLSLGEERVSHLFFEVSHLLVNGEDGAGQSINLIQAEDGVGTDGYHQEDNHQIAQDHSPENVQPRKNVPFGHL